MNDDVKIRIDEKHYNEQKHINRRGEILRVIPAHTDKTARAGRIEIAIYSGLLDVWYCRTGLIERDFSKPVYERALNGCCGGAYEEFFRLAGITPDTKLSEYTNA